MHDLLPHEVTFADGAPPPDEGIPPEDVLAQALDLPDSASGPAPFVADNDPSPQVARRRILLSETGDAEGPQDAILRMTRIGTPVRVSSQEHRWFRRIKSN